MARYYIDTDDGGLLLRDEEGLDHADARSARDLALATLPEMARHGLGAGGRGPFSARVRDACGRTLYSASLRLEDEWAIEPPPPKVGFR